MKKYSFPLERVLALRRTEASLVRSRLEVQLAEVRKQDEFRREIARQAAESATAGRQSGVTAVELAGAENFRRYASRADAMVAAEQQKTMAEVQRQRQLLMEAERKVKALETLDERGRVKWRKEMEHEVEQFAAEAYLSRWSPAKKCPADEAQGSDYDGADAEFTATGRLSSATDG